MRVRHLTRDGGNVRRRQRRRGAADGDAPRPLRFQTDQRRGLLERDGERDGDRHQLARLMHRRILPQDRESPRSPALDDAFGRPLRRDVLAGRASASARGARDVVVVWIARGRRRARGGSVARARRASHRGHE
eukprot:31342-Pelagococcus_subviridis.AAC.38